jgi:DNA-binding NarL/FixJ family response regulator
MALADRPMQQLKRKYVKERCMAEKHRILIAEDHTILREGLRALLSLDPGIEVVGEVENGRDAVRAVEQLKPDLVLMDLSMPGTDGLAGIREINRRYPMLKTLALTVHKTEEYIRAALQAGANGYVLKDATHGELMLAIKTVLSGKTYLSPSVSDKVINRYLDDNKVVESVTPWETLTSREREVLKLIAEGRRNKDIASYLFVSIKTVEKHRSNLMKKLDLHNASALTSYAIERGLVQI